MESWPLALLLDGMCSCEMLSAVKRQYALPESHILGADSMRGLVCLTRMERVNEKPKPISGFTRDQGRLT